MISLVCCNKLTRCVVKQLTDFGLSEGAVALTDLEAEIVDGVLVDDHGSDISDAMSANSSARGGMLIDIDAPDDSAPLSSQSNRKYTSRSRMTMHTNGRCGTPDYLSPEIILGHPHGPPVDYWALGVILYEMLVGFPPFNDDTVDEIFSNILERTILWPDGEKCISPEAMDLIDRLLDPNPATRISWEGLVVHPFFEGIDWDTLLDSVPPFVPTLEGPLDTSYFNNRNLTDIFIDDDEFEIASQSVRSGSPSDDIPAVDSLGQTQLPNVNDAASDLNTTSSALSSAVGTELSATDNQQGAKSSAWEEPTETAPDADEDNQAGETVDNLHLVFEAFRSFSYTNMNALVAASRSEANMIADAELNDADVGSGWSILI